MKSLLTISDRQQLLAGVRYRTGVFKPYVQGVRLRFRAAQQPKYWRMIR